MDKKRLALVSAVAALAVVGAVSAVLVLGSSGSQPTLPPGCVKPADGYLVVAGDSRAFGVGFNDSRGHGAPQKPWPVINVTQGTLVTIRVCNADTQAHSLNVTHYLESPVETVSPGQVITLQFVANQKGVFTIYCDVFCTIHIYMQSGELVVT